MNAMLVVILLSVALGLVARRFGAREQAVVALLAMALTAVYFFFGTRFM